MNSDIRRKIMVNEISKKIEGKRSVTIDCIKIILENDVLFYIPSFTAASVLVEQWDRMSQFNIIVVNKIANFRKMGCNVIDSSCIGDLLEGKFTKNLIITLSQIEEYKELLTKSYFFDQSFSCIFEDCEAEILDKFDSEEKKKKNFTDHWLFGKSIFNFFITRTPSIFNNYIHRPYRFVNFFVHKSYLETSFLKAVENSGQMIYFDNSSVDRRFLSLVREKNSPAISKMVEYLLNLGLFYSPLFKKDVKIENDFISGKIAAFLSTLDSTKGYLTYIYINDPVEQFLIYHILMYVSRKSDDDVDINFEMLVKMIELSVSQYIKDPIYIKLPNLLSFKALPSSIQNRTIKETGATLNIQFLHNIKDKPRSTMCNIICFDYIPFIGRDYKIFILPLAFKEAFIYQLEEDLDIAKYFCKRTKDLVNLTLDHDDQQTIHKINRSNVLRNEYTENQSRLLQIPDDELQPNKTNIKEDMADTNALDPTVDKLENDDLSDKDSDIFRNSISKNNRSYLDIVCYEDDNLNENAPKIETVNENFDFKNYCLIDFSTKPISSHSSYRFQLLSGTIDQIRKKTQSRKFIVSTSLENGKIIVNANCLTGKAAACLNIQNLVKEPVLMPKLTPPKSLVFSICDKFEFCTITSFKTIANSKVFHGDCFLIVSNKKITLFSFSNERNLMIEFASEDLENYVLISLNKTGIKKVIKKSSDEKLSSTISSIASDKAIEVYKECLELSFCLKNKPRIYFCERSEEISKKLKSSAETAEKCQFFTQIEWKRLTLNEFTDLEERFDIRISIPCYQDIPVNVYNALLLSLPLNNAEGCVYSQNGYQKSDLSCLSTPMLRRYHLETFVGALSPYPVQLVTTAFENIEPALSLKQILEYFSDFEFSEFYSMACLISRKGRFLLSHINKENLEFISQQTLSEYCPQLDKTLTERFETVNFKIQYGLKKVLSSSAEKPFIRSVILTPMGFSFDYEIPIESNRILRNFDPDKFCKLLIRDENGRDKFIYNSTKNTDFVYEYFRNVLLNGFTLGLRKYFFLVMTNSQLRVHGCWFVTPYEHDNQVIGSDYIKSWIGTFHSIRNIGKYAARIGLALSSTIFARNVTDFVEIEDTIRNDYSFTDGIGLCSRSLALQICQDLGLEHVPSAFQIRFGGYKGVIAVHPWMDNYEFYTDNPFVCEIIEMIKTRKSIKNKELSEESLDNLGYDSNNKKMKICLPNLILRKSMNKFDSNNTSLEIVNVPKSCDFYLNRQIIMMLEGLGVSSQVFVDFQNKYIYDLLVSIKNDFPGFVKTHSILSSYVSTDIHFYRKLQTPIISTVFEELNAKSNILIPQGRGAMGVVDELGLLEEDQVFCMLSKRNNENMESLIDYGSYVVPNCYCIVAKNPVMHPGDIRLVKCVDIPALHYLKDLIVFSKKGNRPVFNQCSGSDLDGDIFYLCWAKALIPKATFKPYNYNDTNALIKDRVLFSDIVNFFIRSMKFYQLGHIANSYLAIADKYSVFNEKALKLSEIFNKSIDYVKTGNLVAVPDDLIPTEFPDFMERYPFYKSNRALGLLYRRSLIDLSGLSYCECHNCTMKEVQDFCKWKEFILLGSGIKTRETIYKGLVDNEYTDILANYKQDIRYLMNKYQVPNEGSLFCEKNNGEIRNDVNRVVEQYTALLKNKNALIMSAISSCGFFTSLEVLCPDSYKLKNYIKKGIIKNGSSSFVFNSKICLQDASSITNLKNFGKLVDSFYNNTYEINEISIPCNKSKIEEFLNLLDWKRKDIFKDFFNLILLSGLFKITEIDLIFDYFIDLNSQMVESSVLELLKVAIPKSNELTFKILCLLPLDFSLQKKCFLLRQKVHFSTNEAFRPFKICKRTCFIVSGMLDENDDLEFIKKDKKFIPELRNKGKCSVDYYKDTLRDFIVNLLYSQENIQFLKNLKATKVESKSKELMKPIDNSSNEPIAECNNSKEVSNLFDENLVNFENKNEVNLGNSIRNDTTKVPDYLLAKNSQNKTNISFKNDNCRGIYGILLTPGEFFFTNIPMTHINDRISVKYLEQILSSKNPKDVFNYSFNNIHDSLNPVTAKDFLNKIKPLENIECKEILSFVYDNKRYDIEYLNNKILRITKNKIILGKSFILNNSERNDLKVEVFRKELIYDQNLNLLDEIEQFMTKELVKFNGKAYEILPGFEKIEEIQKLKLEKISTFSNDDYFTMSHTESYSDFSNGLLCLKNVKKSSYVFREFSVHSLDNFNFDKIFGKLWRLYNQVL